MSIGYNLPIAKRKIMLDFEVHWENFKYGDDHIHGKYKPIPSSSILPDWFKRLEPEISDGNNKGVTAKRCRGLYDIMASGYMVLWPFDAKISKDDNGRLMIYKARTGHAEEFHPHPHFQVEGYPDMRMENQTVGIQKLTTPYRIKTPEGTSILVKQPAYRPELRTEVMEGIIDSDSYYGDFNILFIIKEINTSRSVIIKAGTPLAQVIPFVRGDWQMKTDKVDEDKAHLFESLATNIDRFYQKEMWNRKVFKDEGS
jgi:hypothetical protein